YQQKRMWLQPFNEVYFDENISSRYIEQRNIIHSWILAGVSLSAFMIAGINYKVCHSQKLRKVALRSRYTK
ncbi:MAG: hypothetical protein WED82_08265, partial [Balneolales bacterium]